MLGDGLRDSGSRFFNGSVLNFGDNCEKKVEGQKDQQ